MSHRAKTIRNELAYMLGERPKYDSLDLVELDFEIEHLLDELSEIEGRRVGLRSFEVPQIRWEHIDDDNKNSWHKLKVPRGKGDKYRETRLPHELYLFIRTYIRGLDDRDAPLVDVTERTICRWVEDVREDFGGATYDEDENVVE